MFRIGGSAEGITSGLAPRQGYQGTDQAWDQFVKKIPDIRAEAKKATYKPRGTNVYDFLTEFGLDIASRPPVPGGILATAATSAKEPYQRFMQRKGEADLQEYASESDMFKTMLSSYGDIMAAKEEGAGKSWLEQWKFEQIPLLNTKIDKLKKEIIDPDLSDEKKAEKELELETAIDQKSRIVSLDPVTEAWLKTKDGGYAVVDMKDKLVAEDLKLEPEERKYKGKKDIQLTIDAIAAVKSELGMAKGGRVGYQGGKSVMPGATQAALTDGYDTSGLQGYDMEGGFQPSNLQGFPAQGEEIPEELRNIDYETLRARLPSSVTDDIVRLIATSAEAMEDFATIQTQQDINNFNKKYGVELVLPAEA